MTTDLSPAVQSTSGIERAPLRARVSWMLFDWAAQPYYTLVQTFLFAPYFANAVVQNATCGTLIKAGSEQAACGQTLWGYAASVAGLLIAAGAISSVKTAMIAALAGAPAVGPGIVVAGTVSVTRGRVVSARTAPPPPRIGSRPWSPPQPAKRAVSRTTTGQMCRLEWLTKLFICCPS